MAERGTWFDPNLLVLHNYLDHHDAYTFTDAQLKTIQAGIAPTQGRPPPRPRPRRQNRLRHRCRSGSSRPQRRRIHLPGPRRRRNPHERGSSAPPPFPATALSLGDQIGTIAPGYQADFVAVAGNPSPTSPPSVRSALSCALAKSTSTCQALAPASSILPRSSVLASLISTQQESPHAPRARASPARR